jgi:hypothetical protein
MIVIPDVETMCGEGFYIVGVFVIPHIMNKAPNGRFIEIDTLFEKMSG